jgi:membrane associated rhomboid family serine protease
MASNRLRALPTVITATLWVAVGLSKVLSPTQAMFMGYQVAVPLMVMVGALEAMLGALLLAAPAARIWLLGLSAMLLTAFATSHALFPSGDCGCLGGLALARALQGALVGAMLLATGSAIYFARRSGAQDSPADAQEENSYV